MPAPKSAIARSARGITRYLQLYHHLARELAEGRFAPDEPLPSEPDLVRLHRVSRTTVRRALDRLEQEGRIARRRGSGTYARAHREDPPLMLALQELCDLRARGGVAKTLESGIAAVPRGLQTRHDTLGQRTRVTRRLRSRRGEAFQLETIYLCNVEDNGNGHSGKIQRVLHEIGAIAADGETARLLRVTAGTPLLRVKTEFHGKDGCLLAVGDTVIRCDRAGIQTEMERDGRTERWSLKPA